MLGEVPKIFRFWRVLQLRNRSLRDNWEVSLTPLLLATFEMIDVYVPKPIENIRSSWRCLALCVRAVNHDGVVRIRKCLFYVLLELIRYRAVYGRRQVVTPIIGRTQHVDNMKTRFLRFDPLPQLLFTDFLHTSTSHARQLISVQGQFPRRHGGQDWMLCYSSSFLRQWPVKRHAAA